MDQSLHTPKPYDYRQYDRIWQRVAPELEPYPGWKEQAVPALADLTPSGGTSGTLGDAGTAAQGADAAPEAASRTEASQEAQPSAGLTLAEEAQLPSAQENPCCMGTAASEMLAVIQGLLTRSCWTSGMTRPWPGRRRPGPGDGCGNWRPPLEPGPGG